MEYARAASLIAHQVKVYFSDVLPLAREAFRAALATSFLFLRLLYVLTLPLLTFSLHLYSLLAPFFTLLLNKIWAAFCLQPAHVLALEAGAALFLLFLTWLEKRFSLLRRLYDAILGSYRSLVRRYKFVLDSVRAKSRTAALAFPHVLFFLFALVIHYTAGNVLTPFTQGFGMVLVACVRPAIKTVFLLYSVDVEEYNEDVRDVTERSVLIRRDDDETVERPSNLRRRRKGENTASADPMRIRAANVAAEIENDGQEVNILRQPRVRINETPQFREEKSESRSLIESTPHSDGDRGRPGAFLAREDSVIRSDMEVSVLRFWIVFGLVWGMRSLAWYFCPALLEHFVTGLDTALFYFFLWAQLGMTCGANVVYSVVAGVARRRWRLDGSRKGEERRLEQVNLFMRLAVMANLVSAERASDVTDTVTESGLALLGVVFLITPRVATFLGTLLIGLLVPCYLSTSALETRGAEGLVRHNWLSYWSVYSLMDAGFAAAADMFGWLPLWYHVKMVLILWLQLPYYRGSVAILEYVMRYVASALSSVKKQVVTPRKRKRA